MVAVALGKTILVSTNRLRFAICLYVRVSRVCVYHPSETVKVVPPVFE